MVRPEFDMPRVSFLSRGVWVMPVVPVAGVGVVPALGTGATWLGWFIVVPEPAMPAPEPPAGVLFEGRTPVVPAALVAALPGGVVACWV